MQTSGTIAQARDMALPGIGTRGTVYRQWHQVRLSEVEVDCLERDEGGAQSSQGGCGL